MMKVALLLVVGLACVLAQPEDSGEQNNGTMPTGPEAIMARVQMEEFIARKYLDVMLKMQHAQYASSAASMFLREWSAGAGDDVYSSSSSSSSFGNGRMFEQQFPKTRHAKNQALEGYEDADQSTGALRLQAAFTLYSANKIKFYQTVFRTSDLQREFWMDRAVQIAVGGAGDSLPPLVYRFLYLKKHKTSLETMKLALCYQYVNQFTSWLEDEMDVNSVLADGYDEYDSEIVADQADDLIRDRIWAFTAFNSHAMIDFSVFYIDLYLEATYAAALAPPPEGGNSTDSGAAGTEGVTAMLEEEATAQPSQVIPAMLYGSYPAMYMKYYKLYYLVFQLYAAHSGLTSAFAEKMAYERENDDDETNDDEIDQYRSYAKQLFYGGFASSLLQASQLEYITSIFEIYSLFTGGAGSFGPTGSLGQNGSFSGSLGQGSLGSF